MSGIDAIMVARSNFSVQHLMQVTDDDDERDFITLDVLKPTMEQHDLHQSYHPTYFQLSSIAENPCLSNISYQSAENSKSMTMELQSDDSTTLTTSNRKRKLSFQETSDPDDENGDGSKSVKTNDENKKQNHSEIEKRRRDKMNTYITELSAMLPMCHAMTRKLDKLTVLRMAVQHLKTIRGAIHSYTEGHYKPSFLSDQELKHLILQAADGFLFVVGCDRGRILYVSQSVSNVLNFSQGDLLGQSLFDILHPKDVAKIKEQLSSSDLNPRERLIDAKTMLPMKTDVPQGGTRLCPGARRSFCCRMKCKMSEIKEEADTTTGCHSRRKKLNNNSNSSSDRKYSVIQCTGYLKSWPPTKIGFEEQEGEGDGDSTCNLSCLAAVGRLMPHISSVATVTHHQHNRPNVHPIQFISRYALDGKFLFIDQRATLVLGFLPQELLGSSMYEYYHHDDIHAIAESHRLALQTTERVTTKVYRFRSKDGGFVRLQSEWKSFKNPWTKEIEYLISKNSLIITDSQTVESSAARPDGVQESFDFFVAHSNGKDIQRIINNHVELSKIGRDIASQVMMDSQRRDGDMSSSCSPDPVDQDASMPMSSAESHISTSIQPEPPCSGDGNIISNSILNNYSQHHQHLSNNRNNESLSLVHSGNAASDEGIIDMVEDVVREAAPINTNAPPSTDGNDEAAMAVIMSLLEADAGLGGPVDFSGLPWPLP